MLKKNNKNDIYFKRIVFSAIKLKNYLAHVT